MSTEATHRGPDCNDQLGPLPEPSHLAGTTSFLEPAYPVAMIKPWRPENRARFTTPLFTTDQMRAYASAAVAARKAQCHEACAALQRSLAEVTRLRAELDAEKKWGELWYFVSDEAPLEFEKIVSEWTPSRWIDQAHKLMAEKRGPNRQST